MKPNWKFIRSHVAACWLLFGVSAAHASVTVVSFESGDLSGWSAGTINGSTIAVNTDRASDGTFSAGVSFAVPASFSGNTSHVLLSQDPRTFMDAGTTTLAVDVYSDWANSNSWGLWANQIELVLNYEGGWVNLPPTSGSLVNGSFSTITWDLSSNAATITNPGLVWSNVDILWHVGTWAGDGFSTAPAVYTDNGTQTFAVDNITVTSAPEPSSILLLGFCGMGMMIRRKR